MCGVIAGIASGVYGENNAIVMLRHPSHDHRRKRRCDHSTVLYSNHIEYGCPYSLVRGTRRANVIW